MASPPDPDAAVAALHDAQLAREARALAEIVQQINQSLELERVFTLVARHAADLLGAHGARVGTIDSGEMVLQGAFGGSPVPIGTRLPLAGTVAGDAVRDARPVRTADVRAEAGLWSSAELAEGAGPVNAVAVPLLVGGRAIGAILVFGNASREFDERDERLLLTLGNHAAIAIENARLYRAAARTARHASILAETARALAQQVTPRSLYEEIGRIAMRSLGAAGVSLYLADPETRHVELALGRGISGLVPERFTERFWALPAGEVVRSATARFASDAETLLASYDEETIAPSREVGLRSLALLPILVEGQPRGLLSLRYVRRHEFDDSERLLLGDFATQVAVAIRNARLFADLEHRAARFAAVATVQQAISASVSLDAVYREIYRAVASVVDAPCFVFLAGGADARRLVPQYVVVDGTERPLTTPPLAVEAGDFAAAQTWRSGIARIASRPVRWWAGSPYEEVSERHVAIELDAPVVFAGRTLGVIQVLSYAPDAYALDDVDLVGLLARQAGLAIENARLFDGQRTERELAEAGAAIARAALEGGTTRRVAQRVVRILLETSGCDGISLAMAEDETLHQVAGIGLPADGGVVVSLVSDQRAIGVIGAVGSGGARPTPQQCATIERLAAPTALALDAVRLAEREREQHERERMLATALATMDQPVFVLALDSRIRYANAAAEREYGYPRAELDGMRVSDLIASARPASGERASAPPTPAAAASGLPMWTAEHVHRRKDGREFPAAVAMSRITDELGAPVGHVLTARNLTDERRIAEQLRQAEKLAALGELVAGVAHELNNPLTGISAFAQLLLEDELGGEQEESVRLIKKESDRAVGVIRDLLLFSRKTGPRRVPIDLNALVQQTLRLRAYGLRSTGVSVVTELDPELPPLEGDDQRLQQLLLNLVTNAEYAMQRSTRRQLTLRTRQQPSPETPGERLHAVVEVADTGTGMPKEVLEHIFEPFFTTKPAGVGTGLGLSVSYGIVQTHGGSITVESTPGVGTCFTIALPVFRERGAPRS